MGKSHFLKRVKKNDVVSFRRDRQFKIHISSWKHEALKKIAEKQDKSMTDILNDALDIVLSNHDIEVSMVIRFNIDTK